MSRAEFVKNYTESLLEEGNPLRDKFDWNKFDKSDLTLELFLEKEGLIPPEYNTLKMKFKLVQGKWDGGGTHFALFCIDNGQDVLIQVLFQDSGFKHLLNYDARNIAKQYEEQHKLYQKGKEEEFEIDGMRFKLVQAVFKLIEDTEIANTVPSALFYFDKNINEWVLVYVFDEETWDRSFDSLMGNSHYSNGYSPAKETAESFKEQYEDWNKNSEVGFEIRS